MARENLNGINVPVAGTGEPNDVIADLRRIAEDLPDAIADQAAPIIADLLETHPDVAAGVAGLLEEGAGVARLIDPRVGGDYEAKTLAGVPVAVDINGYPIGPMYSSVDGTVLPGRSTDIVQAAAGTADVDVAPGVSSSSVDQYGNRDFREADLTGAPTAEAGALIVSTLPSTARIFARTDRTRALTGWRRPPGSNGQFQRWVPDQMSIEVHGDSHQADATGGKPTNQRWSSILQANLQTGWSGLVVNNRATGGTCAEEMALVRGALVMPLTAGSGIAASGSVSNTVTPQLVIRNAGNYPPLTIAGWLCDNTGQQLAHGSVYRDGSNAWAFVARDDGGGALSAGSFVFVSDQQQTYKDRLLIIGTAVNDTVNWTGTTAAQAIDRIVAATAAMIDTIDTRHKACLLLGSLTRTVDYPGTLQYDTVVGAHRELAKLWPQWCAAEEMRQYVNQQMIYDMGHTPTTADLTSMNNDTIPAQVTQDNQHLSVAASPYYAAKVQSLLTSKGLLR